MSLKNFLCVLETCSGYLEGVFNSVVYVGKKIRIIGYVDQKISQKNVTPLSCLGGGGQPLHRNFNLIWRGLKFVLLFFVFSKFKRELI